MNSLKATRLWLILLAMAFYLVGAGCESDDYKALQSAIKKLDGAYTSQMEKIPPRPAKLDASQQVTARQILDEYQDAKKELDEAANQPRLAASANLGRCSCELGQADLQDRLGDTAAMNTALAAAQTDLIKLTAAELNARQSITLAALNSEYWWLNALTSSPGEKVMKQIQSARWATRAVNPSSVAQYAALESSSPENLRFIGARMGAAYGHRQFCEFQNLKPEEPKPDAAQKSTIATLRKEYLSGLTALRKHLGASAAIPVLYYQAHLATLDAQDNVARAIETCSLSPVIVRLPKKTHRLELVMAQKDPARNVRAIEKVLEKSQYRAETQDGFVFANADTWDNLKTELAATLNVTNEALVDELYQYAVRKQLKFVGEMPDGVVEAHELLSQFKTEYEALKMDLKLSGRDSIPKPLSDQIESDMTTSAGFLAKYKNLKDAIIPPNKPISLTVWNLVGCRHSSSGLRASCSS